MIGHAEFSALRLNRLFPRAALDAAPYLTEVPAAGPRHFDESFMGGSWHSEAIDGVSFWYPAADGPRMAVAELSGGPNALAAAPGPFIDPARAANANRVLEALGLAVRLGGPAAGLSALAAGQLRTAEFPDGERTFVSLACRAPDLYHLRAVVHEREGLLALEVRRPDLIRANEHEPGTYDQCEGWSFDEGS